MQNEDQSAPQTPVERFLSRWDWGAFWVATTAAFAVYFYTLAPTVTLEDSGELAVAGDYLGVPHPPGYPLWSILAWIFSRVFAFKHTPPMLMQPNPAWAQGLMSAFFGALAAGITAMLISRSGRDMLKGIWKSDRAEDLGMERIICFAGGVAGSLLFAFSPVMWSQCVIVEVYSLNAFFVALILMLAYVWLAKPSDKILFAIALSFGLGLGNWWPSVLLTVVPLALIVMMKDMKLFKDFCVVGGVLVGMIAFNVMIKTLGGAIDEATNRPLYPAFVKMQNLLWARGPYFAPFWIYLAINMGSLVAAWYLLPHGKTVAITFALAELGCLIYLYMPIVSDLLNPPMNWGYPRTWEGFMHAVTRGQYEKINPTDVFTKHFIDQVGFYTTELRSQFILPFAILGFLPFTAWSLKIGSRRVSCLIPALLMATLAVILIVLEKMGASLMIGGLRGYMLLCAGIVGFVGLGLTALAVNEADELIAKFKRRSGYGLWEKIIIVLVFVATFAAILYYEGKLTAKLADPTLELTGTEKFGIIGMLAAPVLIIGLVTWLIYGGLDMKFDFGANSRKWIIATSACFFMMSIIMVVGANPRGDIQDMFIQRVKFITSHALYAFWIGYGFIIGIGFIERVLGKNPVFVWAGFAIAVLLPIYPIVQNAPFTENSLNRDLLKVYGGASQRDHDFGWQFGNYQLRGIDAIMEELKPGEMAPPSADYPPPMGPGAIFFGGTDPGRFVPTYMIYSADVRPDVFLITQNALADHTYMSVMRDLYGEQIWIPAVTDNNEAFRLYHEDVKAGRRPGKVDMRSGRLVVQGVQHVMAINGILCKMLHEHNKWKHDFFVEESYVIPWMYPYMTPHGLILKLNDEPLREIPPDIVKKDMEFWEWYTKRMVSDKKFKYDAVANKSFSKLRSALAGLYEYRNLRSEAEKAYREAIELCPVSPEAHFRLAGMFMRFGRLEDARAIMVEFSDLDPNNSRATGLIKEIDTRKSLLKRKAELEKILQTNKAQLGQVLELAHLYRRIGNTGGFKKILNNVINDKRLPGDAYLTVAKIYSEAKMYQDMDRAIKAFLAKEQANVSADRYKRIAELYAAGRMLNEATQMMARYLKIVPVDARSWHELGVMQLFINKINEGMASFRQAIRYGGNKARDDLRSDPRLGGFRSRPEFAALVGGGVGQQSRGSLFPMSGKR